MGMDTLVNGPKGHRRGDLALVLTFLLSALEIWRSIAPAQAAPDSILIQKVEQMDGKLNTAITDIAVLKSEVRRK